MKNETENVIPLAARALEGIVVLNLSGALGNYCGKLFADMGADVILVEPTGGAATRHMEPKINGRFDAEASLVFQYQNTNKCSIVVDLGWTDQDFLASGEAKDTFKCELHANGRERRHQSFLMYEEVQ